MIYLSRDRDIHQLRNKVFQLCGEDVSRCYQCGKCSAGCPISQEMDLLPHQVMHLLQIDQEEKVLSSSCIWLCATCFTCSTRCPEDIDLARVMDVLRRLAVEKGYQSPEKEIVVFNRMFLDNIKKNGRLYEMGLATMLNIAAKKLFRDFKLALSLISKGRLRFLPHRIRQRKELEKIFDQCQRFLGKQVKKSS